MLRYSQNITQGKGLVIIGETNLSEGFGYPLQLTYTNLIICIEGSALLNVNFKNYLLNPNDILVLSEDDVSIVKRISNDFRSFYCLIDKAMAEEVAYHLPNELFLFLHQHPLCKTPELEADLLKMWITQLQYIKKTCTTHGHIILRNHLQNLFLRMAEEMPVAEIKKMHSYSQKEVLCWKFWELVGKYGTEKRNVAFYADQLNITPFYLSQITKNFFNDSPKGLIDRQVILEIKALLKTTDLAIKEIADRLDFKDTSYMARYFKKLTGVTLTEYRK
ncbi:AraC family transcriptional regulator [Chryseobacterium pennae]|uniref:AraC family transcriptional regulator n=1 Tax=Chryseobacterium pennae TaxID=2258962 RepID=A0A3D9CDH5_9FLAO|nr:helix-turn-helix domain-containing protein [Chryseobacterium pennae]REC63784.1 AraC family transcriptional regulator [Chryseobacterium pennae]